MRKPLFEMIILLFILVGLIQFLSQGKTSTDISYEEYNSELNQTIILIHGSPGSKSHFSLLAPELNRRAYALDMPCFADSYYSEDCGIDNAADAIAEFMDKNNIQRAAILGYSWGGGAAIKFVSKYPQKTEKLILVGGMGIQEGEITGNFYTERARTLLAYPFVVYYPGAFAKSSAHSREGFLQSYLDTDLRPIREDMKLIRAETLILQGDNDNIVPVWQAQEHASLIPNSELSIYHGDHHTISSNITEIAPIINEFIKRKEARLNLFIEQ